LLGWTFTIDFGWPIAWRKEDGLIAAFACFASKLKGAAHLFSHCHYTKRLWGLVKDLLRLPFIRTNDWTVDLSTKSWWLKISSSSTVCKAMTSLHNASELGYL
jgi:hypothetical protein